MTRRTRRNHSGSFKAKVALAALRGDKTLTEIAQQYEVHPNQVTEWKRQLLERAADVFDGGASGVKGENEPDIKTLHAKIGQLALENDFSEVSETKIEPIYQAWLSLPDIKRGEMERDFKEIDALACEGGVRAIIDEADWHDENLVEILNKLEGFHEKAFWLFLERPKYWAGASAFCRADSISGSQWNECRTINNSPANVDDENIRHLERVLSNYFHTKEGRGKNCSVEPYKRGKLNYFFGMPVLSGKEQHSNVLPVTLPLKLFLSIHKMKEKSAST